MTRILVQRGFAGQSSSSNQNRPSTSAPSPSSSSASPQPQATSTAQVTQTVKDENLVEVQEQNVLDELSDHRAVSDNKSLDFSPGSLNSDLLGKELVEDGIVHNDDNAGPGNVEGCVGLLVVEGETDAMVGSSFQKVPGRSYPPPPPPIPPPKPYSLNSTSRRSPSADPNAMRIGPSRRSAVLPGVSIRSPPTGSRPSSPRSHCEGEGYNSADEQSPSFSSVYDDAVSFIGVRNDVSFTHAVAGSI